MMGDGRKIWVDFRKERKLSHPVDCKALGDTRKSVEEVGGDWVEKRNLKEINISQWLQGGDLPL